MAGYNLITDDSEALQAYLNNITHSTPLSLEEEKECADTGDWEKLVNANLGGSGDELKTSEKTSSLSGDVLWMCRT